MKKLYIILAFAMIQLTFNAFSMRRQGSDLSDHVDKKRRTITAVVSLPIVEPDFAQAFKSGTFNDMILKRCQELDAQGLLTPGNRTSEQVAEVDGLKDMLNMSGLRYRNGQLISKGASKVEIQKIEQPDGGLASAFVFTEEIPAFTEKKSSSRSGE